jgi:hypothetical protein
MANSLYPCGAVVDARKPVDYSRLKWSDVFVRSRRFFGTYDVDGMRHWLDIVGQVEFLGLPTYEDSSGGSPGGHPGGMEYYFALLDGGLACHDYWGLRNGCLVIGQSCIRYFCYQLGVPQPRKFREEATIPTLESLQQEIEEQQGDIAAHVVLSDRIDQFRELFRA